MKWQRPELDKIMIEKRAAAAVAGGKGAHKAVQPGGQRSAMELSNGWFLQAPAPGAQTSVAAAPPLFVFLLLETGPHGPEWPLIGNRFKELCEDDAPVSPIVACRAKASPDIQVSPMSLGEDVPVLPTSTSLSRSSLPSRRLVVLRKT